MMLDSAAIKCSSSISIPACTLSRVKLNQLFYAPAAARRVMAARKPRIHRHSVTML